MTRNAEERRWLRKLERQFKYVKYEGTTFQWVDHREYTPDYYIGEHVDGRPVYIEIKGVPSYEQVRKVAYTAEQNNVHIWVVLLSNSEAPSGKTWQKVYTERGVPCAVNHIPNEWESKIKPEYRRVYEVRVDT